MTIELSSSALEQAAGFIERSLGLHFPQSRWKDLERGLRQAAPELGFLTVDACAEAVARGALTREQLQVLAGQLTVGETYFFRDRGVFEALETTIIPELMRARSADRRLRIWSAGCCTGEEPYSLAMLLDRLAPAGGDWNVSILGTDINPAFLRKASAAVYKDWSFRDGAAELRGGYFSKAGVNEYRLDDRIRRRVSFAPLNLAEDTYPSFVNGTTAIDLIVCRNVLMYFSPRRVKEVVARLRRCLSNGGWLIVSATETSQQVFREFKTVQCGKIFLYRKDAGLPAPVAPAAVPAMPEPLAEPEPRSSRRGAVSVLKPRRPVAPPPKPAAVPSAEQAEEMLRTGRLREAETMIDGLLDGPGGQADIQVLKARLLANQGRLDESLEWCKRAIAADSLAAAPHFLRAVVCEELGRLDEAAESLKRTLYLAPESPVAHFASGNLAVRGNRVREARRHFANTLSILASRRPDEPVPESDGMTAGRLTEVTRDILATLA